MPFLNGKDVFNDFVTNTIYEDVQIEKRSVSLTAGNIHTLDTAGELDFGGSEFRLASRSEIPVKKRNSDDDYGWWELDRGTYVLELNETLDTKKSFQASLHPHSHLTWNGAFHPSLHLNEEDVNMRIFLPLSVPSSGLNIKENARVSVLKVERISN